MNILARDILEAQRYLTEFGGIDGLPIALRLQIAKTIRAIKSAAEPLDDVSQKIALEFADKDQDGKPIQMQGGYALTDAAGYRAALKDLGNQPVTLDVPTMKISDLKDSKISANALAALWFAFTE